MGSCTPAVGPTTVHPKQWLPKIWGTKEMMPPMGSVEEANHMLGLVMRHFNTIIAGLGDDPGDQPMLVNDGLRR